MCLSLGRFIIDDHGGGLGFGYEAVPEKSLAPETRKLAVQGLGYESDTREKLLLVSSLIV
jgi:hypothetical protein